MNDFSKNEYQIDHAAVIEQNKSRFFMFCIVVLTCCILALSTINAVASNKISDDALSYLKTQLDLPHEMLIDFVSQNDDQEHNRILTQIKDYPLALLELAIKNEEAIPFVSNYLSYKSDTIVAHSTYQETTSETIPLFLQWDEAWGYSEFGQEYMAVSGCAPTVAAMAIVGLTNRHTITPRVMADFIEENNLYVLGIGTSWELFNTGLETFGLQTETIARDRHSIIQSLEAGALIVVSVAPGTFTETGHFLLITGLTEDFKLSIHDPNSLENSNTTWDIDVFLNESKNLWKVTASPHTELIRD